VEAKFRVVGDDKDVVCPVDSVLTLVDHLDEVQVVSQKLHKVISARRRGREEAIGGRKVDSLKRNHEEEIRGEKTILEERGMNVIDAVCVVGVKISTKRVVDLSFGLCEELIALSCDRPHTIIGLENSI